MQECFDLNMPPRKSEDIRVFENLGGSEKLQKELNKKGYLVSEAYMPSNSFFGDKSNDSFSLMTYIGREIFFIDLDSMSSIYNNGELDHDSLNVLFREQALKKYLSHYDYQKEAYGGTMGLYEAIHGFIVNKIMKIRPEVFQYLPDDLQNLTSGYDFESLQTEFGSVAIFDGKESFGDVNEEELLKEFYYDEIIALLDWVPGEKSYDEMYVDEKFRRFEEGRSEICESTNFELQDFLQIVSEGEAKSEEIITEGVEGKLGELLAFLEENEFRYNPIDDFYISKDRKTVLTFPSDDSNGYVGNITLQNSPSGKHIADADTFMGEYFKTGYKKYDFQKY